MKKIVFVPPLFLLVTLLFFYPLFKGQIPFPGDNLVGNYAPYNSYSHLGYAPGGVPNKAQGPDVIREVLPWKSFVVASLKHGQLPFWNPHNFSGNPLMANFQSAVFYPFNLLFFLLPLLSAWSILIFSAPFLAAFFTYLFLRELKLSQLPSIFGGLVFGFSSYMVVWLEYGNITHTFLWLPLALVFTEKLTNKFTKRDFLFLILTLWLSFLGGYIQGYFYILMTLAFYFFGKTMIILRNKETEQSLIKGMLFLIALVSPLLLSLFQLLPTLDLFTSSTRGNYSLEQIQTALNPVWYLITVMIPDFFGNPGVRNYWFNGTYIERVSYFGLIPFIFAIAALFSFKKNPNIRILGLSFIIILFIATDLFVTKYLYKIPIPVISTTIPTRILGLFQFFGAILAAFGLEMFLQKKNKKGFLIASFFVLFFIVGVFCFTFTAPHLFPNADWISHMAVIKRNSILPLFFSLLFLCLVSFQFDLIKRKLLFKLVEKKLLDSPAKRDRSKNIFVGVIIIFIVAFDLFYFFHKITPFSPKEFAYPSTPVIDYVRDHAGSYRSWGYGSGYIQPNFQTYDTTYSPEGDDPLHVRWYTEFLETSKDGKLPKILPRPDANIANGYGPEDLKRNYYRQKVLNLLGVKYILHKDDSLGKEYRPDIATFSEKKYKLVWQEAPWQIYENLSVVPRAFLTTDYKVVSEGEKFFETFYKKDFNESKTIILDTDPNLTKHNEIRTMNNAKIISYTPNKVVIKTNSDIDALLFLSDNYYPEWKATVDGKDTLIYRADYTFRAVVVPAGKHEIVFYYDPIAFKKGLLLSGVFAAALTILLLKLKLNK